MSIRDNLNYDIIENFVSVNRDYKRLVDKPKINDVELDGNKSFHDLGLYDHFASTENLNEVNEQLNSANEKITSLDDDVTSLQLDKENLDNDVRELQRNLATHDENISNTTNRVSTLETDVNELETSVNDTATEIRNIKSAIGTPLTASTVSEMTNTNKIYVYVGSEEGYINGNWYYYSNGSWISGGVYNSTALETDKTLSINGNAADAKVVGTAIQDVKNTMNRTKTSVNWISGNIQYETGEPKSSTLRIRSDYISLNDYTVKPNDGYQFYLYFYGENTQYLGSPNGSIGWFDNTIDVRSVAFEGATQFRIVVRNIGNNEITPEDGVNVQLLIPIEGYLSDVKTELKESIDDLSETLFFNTINDFELGGIMVDTGADTTNVARMRTGFHKIEQFKIDWGSSEFQYIIVYYDENKQLLSATEWSDESQIIKVSDIEDAAYVRFIFWNSVRKAGYKFSEEGLSLPDNCVITGTNEVTNEIDDTLTITGMAADAGAVGEILAKIGWIPTPEFVQGTRVNNGGYVVARNDIITTKTPIYVGEGTTVNVQLADRWRFGFLYGNSEDGPWVREGTVSMSGNYTAKGDYLYLNMSKLDENGDVIPNITPALAVQEKALFLLKGLTATTESDNELQYDIPENLGMINLRKRAQQLTEISYNTTNPDGIPWYNTNLNEYRNIGVNGGNVKGLPYQGTWRSMSFIPQNLSFHSFMTSVMNPKSYLYTRQNNDSGNRTYFGTVCSSFISYCYGLNDRLETTATLEKMDGMTENEDQSVYGLKIGDLLSLPYKHVAVVTDILRNKKTGEIHQVFISEGAKPTSRIRGYTPQEYETIWIGAGYKSFRWSKLYSVDYESTPWVNIGDETERPVYNTLLFPRRGDKANWPYEETWTDPSTDITTTTTGLVEIDIIGETEYTQWRLYKDDDNAILLANGENDVSVNINSNGITGTGLWNSAENLISFNNLSPGFYKLCLVDGNAQSGFVYFCITDYDETYEKMGVGSVKCTANSEQGVPVTLSWSNPEGERYIAVLHTDKFPTGQSVIEATHDAGIYNIRVGYKNKYGLWYSPREVVDLT